MRTMRTRRIEQIAAVAAVTLVSAWMGQARGDFFCSPPTRVANVNIANSTLGGSISADGLTLYFAAQREDGYGGTFDIYLATRSSTQDPWSQAVNIGPAISSAAWEYTPNISPDGLSLYFSSDRPGGSGGMDTWVATRPTIGSPWNTPANLGPAINSSAWDLSPRVSVDGLTLLFHSQRSGGFGGEDIWMSTRATKSDPWSTPANLGAPVNSGANDGEAALTADGLTLFFNSDRAGGSGNYDLWVTTRRTASDPWGPPRNLGKSVNSPAIEWCGSISPDGLTLYFTSDRPTAWGPCSIYQTTITPVVDFNGDGKVDGDELRTMTESLGEDVPLCDIGPTPFGDGVVDAQDLLVLAQYVAKDATDPALVACWKLDETEGGSAQDSVGADDATLVGGPLWQPEAGAVGGAIALDGIDDCLIAKASRDPSKAPLSVMVWVKGGLPGQVILSQAGGANWLVVDAKTGMLMTDLQSGGRTSKALKSNTVITDGLWHRIGLIWDGTTRTLCVDGVVVAQDAHDALKSAWGGLNIGGGKDLAPGTFWSGLIDDVRLYHRVVKP